MGRDQWFCDDVIFEFAIKNCENRLMQELVIVFSHFIYGHIYYRLLNKPVIVISWLMI